MQPVSLRVEYLENPIGLESLSPRLYWKLKGDPFQYNLEQDAWQVQVASCPLHEDAEADLWDSGWVKSAESTHILYQGAPLPERTRAWWRVRVRSKHGDISDWSDNGFWETGLREGWQAEWIESDCTGSRIEGGAAPFLRTGFTIEKEVASARLYASALGLYRAYLNGERVGNDELTPGWTDYSQRVPYQTYDVTGLLSTGQNALGIVLGDGWYCGNLGWWSRQFYGLSPAFIGQLEIVYTDGDRLVIASSPEWRTSFGPLNKNDLMMGEIWDARLEIPGWNGASFDDSGWAHAKRRTFSTACPKLSGLVTPPVAVVEELLPIAPPRTIQEQWCEPRYIYDFGQNLSGKVRLKVSYPKGTVVELRHAEMLTPEGDLYVANLRRAKATDYYICRGDGEEIWEPLFTFHGFRYVEISGIPSEPDITALTALAMQSSMDTTGSFRCSHPLLNQLQSNIFWSQRDNMLEVPTDCPQRDERLGWTGDAHLFLGTACFNMNVAPFFTKWLHDLRESQREDGSIPVVAPNPNVFQSRDGGPGWSEAIVICPWVLYLHYGDKRILEENLPAAEAYMGYLTHRAKDFLVYLPEDSGWEGYGDWLSLDGSSDQRGLMPKELVGTAFFAYAATLMAEIHTVLGREEDALVYRNLFASIRSAFQRRFITPDGFILGNNQTVYVWALQFDLVSEAQRPLMLQRLLDNIRRREFRLSTGFLGTPYLMHALSDGGAWTEARKLLLQTGIPSWLYAVTQGATTIWERWNGYTEKDGFFDPSMNSFNHYAYGAIGEWMIKHLGGIHRDAPGYRRFVIRPELNCGVDSAIVTYDSLYGEIAFEWNHRDGKLTATLEVPPNTKALLDLPTATGEVLCMRENETDYTPLHPNSPHLLGSGRYSLLTMTGIDPAKELTATSL